MDPSAMQTIEERQQFYNGLVARGLRAQLKTGSFLTGQCYVDMDFHPNADNQRIIWGGPHPNFPTIQTTSEEVLSVIKNIANKMEDFPIQQIGEDLQGIIKNLKKLTQQLSSSEMQSIVSNVNEIAGQIRKSELDNFMANLNQTILAFEKILSSDSVFNQEATRALREVADAASQIRTLADYLERHPDALIYGKGE
jgi:paraquat-inducible protein B